MTTDRFDKLAPRDLLITLRSIPRRLEALIAAERQDSVAWSKREQPQADGSSFTDVVVTTGLRLAATEAEVAKLLTHKDPIIWKGTLNAEAADSDRGSSGPPMGVEGGEELAKSAALAIADRLDNLTGAEWARKARLTGGGEISALELAQHAARIAISGLGDIERKSNR